MFEIENETFLHCKVVQRIRRFYPEAILIAGLGENQDTAAKRISSWKKGYMKGQPDIIIMNNHKEYNGLCIEFKSPTNNYEISKEQLEMHGRYHQNGYRFMILNDHDKIITYLDKRMLGIRIPCKYRSNQFCQRKHIKRILKVSIRNK